MPTDEPRSLLKRLLKRAEDRIRGETKGAAATAAAKTEAPSPRQPSRSPVRPPQPESPPDAQPIAPKTKATQPLPQILATVEDRLQAESALEDIREKTASIAAEFAQGKINRAQFLAVYGHYNEKRVIIERLLARDPDTNAWKPVANAGRTTFLRAQFEARVLSYSIYEQKPPNAGKLLTSQGRPQPEEDMVAKLIQAIQTVVSGGKQLLAQRKELKNGQWLVFAPGEYTTAMAVFSLEPSPQQTTRIQDTHRDFERANKSALARGIRQLDQLVFPHRALFGAVTEREE